MTDGNSPIVFVQTWRNALLRSTDNGDSWSVVDSAWSWMDSIKSGSSVQPIERGTMQSLLVRGRTLFMGRTNLGVYYSLDAGLTWSPINDGMRSQSISCFVLVGDTLLAGTTDRGVFTADVSSIPRRPLAVVRAPEGVCAEADTTVFLATYGDAPPFNVEWQLAGGSTIPGNEINAVSDTSITLHPSRTRSYRVVVTDHRGQSDTQYFSIIVHPYPSGTIAQSGDTLWCRVAGDTTGITYQWFEKKDTIPGATGAFLIPSRGGLYAVDLTQHGCISISEAFAFDPSSVAERATPRSLFISAQPNPARDAFAVHIDGRAHAGVIDIFDALGRPLHHSIISAQSQDVTIPCDTWAPGMYAVRWKSSDGIVVTKMHVLH